MPWKPTDAHKHKKGLTPTQAKRWSAVANAALIEYGDEGKAIRVANSRAKGTPRKRTKR